MSGRTKAYWAVTGLFCLAFTMGGTMHLIRAEAMQEGMRSLGYPIYVTTILGVAKLLGVVALLAPGRPLLKEWAYAGFTFNLIGAFWAHSAVGDAFAESAAPLVLLGVLAASYVLRPEHLTVTNTVASEPAPTSGRRRRSGSFPRTTSSSTSWAPTRGRMPPIAPRTSPGWRT